MTVTQKYFCDLLSAFLNKAKAPAVPEGIDFAQLTALAKVHSVTGMVGHMLAGNSDVPADTAAFFKHQALVTVMRSHAHTALGETVIAKFAENGIESVPVKGAVIRNLYPLPELRTFGDIDILVNEENAEKAHSLMMDMGFKHTDGQTGVRGYSSKDGFNFEIHNRLSGERQLSQLTSGEIDFFNTSFNYVVPAADGKTLRLDAEYHFAYCIWHLTKHLALCGAGVRMFMDIAAIIKYDGITDWDKVVALLEKLELMTSAESILFLCSRWFDTEIPSEFKTELDEPTYESMCKYVLNSGTFGFNGRTTGSSRLRNEMGSSENAEKARRKVFLRMFFPTAAYLKEFYPWYSGNRLLLPFIWIYRFGDVLINRRKSSLKAFGEVKNGGSKEMAEYTLLKTLGWLDNKK